MTPPDEARDALARALGPAELRRLRRIAREARNTYVGRHWPSMESMRDDGIGYGLVEDRDHERFIRRYLDTFQPEFVLDLLDRLSRLAASGWVVSRVSDDDDLGAAWAAAEAALPEGWALWGVRLRAPSARRSRPNGQWEAWAGPVPREDDPVAWPRPLRGLSGYSNTSPAAALVKLAAALVAPTAALATEPDRETTP